MTDVIASKTFKEKRSFLKRIIEEQVFIKGEEQRMVDQNSGNLAWIMDFRRVILQSKVLQVVSELFLETLHENEVFKFQIGGLESAAIPLISGVVMKSAEQRGGEVNGFFIRKSRKKYGLLQIVEGVIGGEEIILVDDLLNSGNSILKQIAVLESLGKKVSHVCVILKFKNIEEYAEITKKGIAIHALFSLEGLDVSPIVLTSSNMSLNRTVSPLAILWSFASPGAILEYVCPKSSPVLYEGMLYFGSDNGAFWCINASDASVVWQRKVLYGPKNKKIFSSPVILNKIVYFGGYDGNFYALDYKTGKPLWVAFDADWIGSSPCVSDDLGLVFVGVEFGLLRRKGGVIAYRASTGEVVWKSVSPEYVHASPAYSKKHKIVVCGSNDGVISAFSAKDGKVLWRYETGGEIKAGCAFSPNQEHVALGSFNKCYVVLETKTGKVVSRIETLEGNYSTPVWSTDNVLIGASLDKCIYAYDISKSEVLWKYSTDARIFASPYIYNNHVYIGNNAGFLFVLDAVTGKNISTHQLVERITNSVIVDPKEKVIYVPTQANQVIKAELPKTL